MTTMTTEEHLAHAADLLADRVEQEMQATFDRMRAYGLRGIDLDIRMAVARADLELQKARALMAARDLAARNWQSVN